jgi:hypothetical protein
MKMDVLEVSLFKSKSLVAMNKDTFKDGEPMIPKEVPPIIDDLDTAKNIESTTEGGGDAMNGVSFGNFLISLLVGASM